MHGMRDGERVKVDIWAKEKEKEYEEEEEGDKRTCTRLSSCGLDSERTIINTQGTLP